MSPPTSNDAPSHTLGPTRVRYRMLGLLCGLSMITYLDRVCFASAATGMAYDLGLSNKEQLKWAHTAFAIAYGAFEIPAGWLGDRLGPRGTLLRIVAWWSTFTMLTGLVGLTVGGWTLGETLKENVVRSTLIHESVYWRASAPATGIRIGAKSGIAGRICRCCSWNLIWPIQGVAAIISRLRRRNDGNQSIQ